MKPFPRHMTISRSGWKSCLIKSIRMGWPAGVVAAMQNLQSGDFGYCFKRQMWEDIFPHPDDVRLLDQQIRNRAVQPLLEYDTHHGRGLTDAFCDLAEEAWKEGNNLLTMKPIRDRMKKIYGVWVPDRVNNCLYTWDKLKAEIPPKQVRPLDATPWNGMPPAMLDGHSRDGRNHGVGETILSGSYEQHRRLGEIVQTDGWEGLRAQVHAEPTISSPTTPDLFN